MILYRNFRHLTFLNRFAFSVKEPGRVQGSLERAQLLGTIFATSNRARNTFACDTCSCSSLSTDCIYVLLSKSRRAARLGAHVCDGVRHVDAQVKPSCRIDDFIIMNLK